MNFSDFIKYMISIAGAIILCYFVLFASVIFKLKNAGILIEIILIILIIMCYVVEQKRKR